MLTPVVVELTRLCAHRAPELRHARPSQAGTVRSAAPEGGAVERRPAA
jgi:hypothetical protein